MHSPICSTRPLAQVWFAKLVLIRTVIATASTEAAPERRKNPIRLGLLRSRKSTHIGRRDPLGLNMPPRPAPRPRPRRLPRGKRFVVDSPGRFVLLAFTFIWRPRKRVSFMANAVSTNSLALNSMYANPFGWPSTLLHRIVTRFMAPQPWKCASSSSAVAP